MNELSKVQIWDAGIDLAYEILVKPVGFFYLETYTLGHTCYVSIDATVMVGSGKDEGSLTSMELNSSSGKNNRNLEAANQSCFGIYTTESDST
jgi:hypothetical protein